MQSAEPAEPSENRENVSHEAVEEDEKWRAEVASRVNSYRARRKRSSDMEAPALDFGPATGAFDTNYYRRLNVESMSQGSSTTIVATALAKKFLEDELGKEKSDPASLEKVMDETPDDLALDLEVRPTITSDSCLDRYRISEPEPEPEPNADDLAIQPPAPAGQGNLIVFRRPLLEPPLAPQPTYDELAEPMNHRPRILEVPEDIMPPVQGSLFPEIRLDADEQEASTNCDLDIEVPLPVAPVLDRLTAAMADLGIVTVAGLLFAWMAGRALPEIPHNKPFFLMLGAVTMLLWAVYQHLFLLYGGCTPGMRMRGIRLSTFDGRAPLWKQRKSRARFVFISFVSVSLGFLWALVDENKLCWHDRISRTFPTSE
jgi:uncharacterized RDD family membrane protein YckC